MEKVIDQVLIDSQHALVTSSPNCRGLRLQGYGLLFVVDLSPIGAEGQFHFKFKEDGSYDLILDDESDADESDRKVEMGRRRTLGRRDAQEETGKGEIEYEDDEEAEEAAEAAREMAREHRRKQELEDWTEELKKAAKHGAPTRDPEREAALERVREELIGVLRDYGHTITGVGPDEFVGIAIFPSDLDWRGPDTRTLIQVKRRSIDTYNNGGVTPEEFAKHVQIVTQ